MHFCDLSFVISLLYSKKISAPPTPFNYKPKHRYQTTRVGEHWKTVINSLFIVGAACSSYQINAGTSRAFPAFLTICKTYLAVTNQRERSMTLYWWVQLIRFLGTTPMKNLPYSMSRRRRDTSNNSSLSGWDCHY